MWKTVLSYAMSSTNYNITNVNNMYNFIIEILSLLNDEQKNALIDSMILHMGRGFYKDFRTYLINKIPNSPYVAFVNRIV